jgi:hypothetical protein
MPCALIPPIAHATVTSLSQWRMGKRPEFITALGTVEVLAEKAIRQERNETC